MDACTYDAIIQLGMVIHTYNYPCHLEEWHNTIRNYLYNKYKKKYFQASIMVHAFNPSTREAGPSGSLLRLKPAKIQSDTLFHTTPPQKKNHFQFYKTLSPWMYCTIMYFSEKWILDSLVSASSTCSSSIILH